MTKKLEDILNLFHLDYKIDIESMKKAKFMALKTHPDKSGLKKDFFLFFMKAYKMLEAIYDYRYKKEQCAKNIEYTAEVNERNKLLLKKLDGKSSREFNTWFNEIFEKVKIRDEDRDAGYGAWFKSNEDVDGGNIKSVAAMEKEFEKRKQKHRALILHKEISDMKFTDYSDRFQSFLFVSLFLFLLELSVLKIKNNPIKKWMKR